MARSAGWGRGKRFLFLALMTLGAGTLFAFAHASVGTDGQPVAATTEAPRGGSGKESRVAPSSLLEQAQQMFEPLPAVMEGCAPDPPARVALGRRLFFEKNLSSTRTQSCASCHPIDGSRAGVDNRPTSPGAEGESGPRNAPTVLNAGFDLALFRDGRAKDLVEQAKGPILSPLEMGMRTAEAAVARVKALDYVALFDQAFPGEEDPVTFDNIARAIAAFERTLLSRSRFDDYLLGDEAALTAEEKQGLNLFLEYGCTECHVGPQVGGNRFMKSGVYHPYPHEKDLGRYQVTRRERDRHGFKVPSLRNVTLTAPYFHDGKVATLAEAVDLMAWMQLDRKLDDEELRLIVQFLTTLADKPRTTAPPPEAERPDWTSFQARLALPPDTELAREGRELLEHTYALLGPGAEKPEDRYSRSALNCVNCHYQRGTKPHGQSWVGVMHRYPRYSGRAGGQETIEDRVNGCLERSMNGRALPENSRPMQAIVAYFAWLSRDVPRDAAGTKGAPAIKIPERAANLEAGREVYQIYCQSCHGADGRGYRSLASRPDGPFVIPPVWGEGSYNNGAGMHRVLTAAAFLRTNMPLGTRWDHPVLTDEQAFDVAAYINSQPRPVKEGLEKDYPDRREKPIDCPYPPYADDFPPSQHQYGPFLPILKARAQAKAEHR